MPAGPIANVTVLDRIASTNRFWPIVFGVMPLPRAVSSRSPSTSEGRGSRSSLRLDHVALHDRDRLADDGIL